MALEPVTITISGPHDTGRTTLAVLFKNFLEESGYRHAQLKDTEPLDRDQKSPFPARWARNRERPVIIQVETIEPPNPNRSTPPISNESVIALVNLLVSRVEHVKSATVAPAGGFMCAYGCLRCIADEVAIMVRRGFGEAL